MINPALVLMGIRDNIFMVAANVPLTLQKITKLRQHKTPIPLIINLKTLYIKIKNAIINLW
jgi:hypothetical protein